MWYLEPILDSYLIVVILALALVTLLGLSPSFGRLTRGQRGVLVVLRGLVIVLVTLAMLRPTYVGTQSRPQASTLIVLGDRSRSMGIGDTAQGKTRWQLQREALRDAAPLLSQLRENMEVLIYAFDAAAHPVAFEGDQLRLDPRPTGDESDIGTSLDDVLERAAGKRLAGVILLSDGAQRGVAPRVDIQQPAPRTGSFGLSPLHHFPGAAARPAQARDVAVENLPDQYTVFVKNELEIHALLRSQGYANREIPVQLVVESPGGDREILGPVPLRPTGDGQQLDIEFVYTPVEPGQYKLTVEAAAQPGELVTSNNALCAFLTVQEGGLRVLYLFGSVLGGQRLECQSISSSPDIQLDYRWVDARQRGEWPISLDADVFRNTYDVILLGDLDSDALGQAHCQALAEAVRAGKGLMMLGGYHSFGPGGYRDTALADVLPVVMGRFERQGFDDARRTDVHINGRLTILPARPHFITRLQPGQQNETAWKQLPPILGATSSRD